MNIKFGVTLRQLLNAFPPPFLGDQWLLASTSHSEQQQQRQQSTVTRAENTEGSLPRQQLDTFFTARWTADHTNQDRWQRSLFIRANKNALGRAAVHVNFERNAAHTQQSGTPPLCSIQICLTFEPCGRTAVLLQSRPTNSLTADEERAALHFALSFAIGQCPFRSQQAISNGFQSAQHNCALPAAPAAVHDSVDEDPIWHVVQNVANATDVSDDVTQHVVALSAALVGWLRTEANRSRLAVWR